MPKSRSKCKKLVRPSLAAGAPISFTPVFGLGLARPARVFASHREHIIVIIAAGRAGSLIRFVAATRAIGMGCWSKAHNPSSPPELSVELIQAPVAKVRCRRQTRRDTPERRSSGPPRNPRLSQHLGKPPLYLAIAPGSRRI